MACTQRKAPPGVCVRPCFFRGENTAREAVHQFDKQGRKGVKTTKENISKVKENIQKRKAAAEQPKKQAERQAARQTRQAADRISEPVKAIRQERGLSRLWFRARKALKPWTGAVRPSSRRPLPPKGQ